MRFPKRAAPPMEDLAALRAEIDRIDAEMHALLIQRGGIIDRLIAVKGTSASGSAFRPGREAAMMRRVAERHRGLLPLDTVEGIWRVIIATFTYVQAPFSVHADISAGDPAMRDSARFHFGFTVPYRPHPTCAAVIEAVAASRGDLGIFRFDPRAAQAPATGTGPGRGPGKGEAWWEGLIGEGRPKVIARLPFIERPAHPAGTPVFVVAKPLDDPAAAHVEACLALIATVEDTNLLHRGGVGQTAWREAAESLHDAFVAQNLSPGGAADLLAMTLFVDAIEAPTP
ncbi:hypothetical protein FV222_22245 [Methylobacterium sp. WL103]|uniref:triphosphoribosyl-dephospho-CoA synthase n=1 Tax=Methylobacterium sp. WL103 TaxID=2603891 RepID=UPI0011CC5A8B|nr:triphosphoribosyl-dephospho-CoA synthase [Methylobacterium sp. WL103]TXM93521.1 hypothetical protein FV222_22245 [Methylobacterium sp. WL103]